MGKFEGINRNYSTSKEDKKSSQEERDRLMKEFLARFDSIFYLYFQHKHLKKRNKL